MQADENGDQFIFVSDYKEKRVFLFDSSFKLIKTIGYDLNGVENISVDSKYLYVSHYLPDLVSIFNYNDVQLTTQLKI